MSATPCYLVIGHITRDLLPGGGFQIGGTATYAALTAHRLQVPVRVLTSAETGLALFEEAPTIEVERRASVYTTTFENLYRGGHRRQYVRAVAEPLTVHDLPPGWEQSTIVHLGPVAQEVDVRLAGVFPNALLGVTPQGWMRHWDAEGLVSPIRWAQAEDLLRAISVVILSPEDVGHNSAMLDWLQDRARLLVLTVGKEGAIVYHRGRRERVPAFEATERDPTGAGDVFAAAYLIRLAETDDPFEAARFANSAASFVIEAPGVAGVPTREQVEWRLRYGRLRD